MTNVIVTGPQFAWNIASHLISVAPFIAGVLPIIFRSSRLAKGHIKGNRSITRPLLQGNSFITHPLLYNSCRWSSPLIHAVPSISACARAGRCSFCSRSRCSYLNPGVDSQQAYIIIGGHPSSLPRRAIPSISQSMLSAGFYGEVPSGGRGRPRTTGISC